MHPLHAIVAARHGTSRKSANVYWGDMCVVGVGACVHLVSLGIMPRQGGPLPCCLQHRCQAQEFARFLVSAFLILHHLHAVPTRSCCTEMNQHCCAQVSMINRILAGEPCSLLQPIDAAPHTNMQRTDHLQEVLHVVIAHTSLLLSVAACTGCAWCNACDLSMSTSLRTWLFILKPWAVPFCTVVLACSHVAHNHQGSHD